MDYIRDTKKHTWTEIPISAISKEEYTGLIGETVYHRLVDVQNNGTDRELVMQCVGNLEKLLSSLLKVAFIDEFAESLVGENGKIRNFDLRIDIAYGLGAITSEEKQQIHLLRNIRNRFAHDADLHHLQHDEKVVGWAQSLVCKVNGPKIDIPLRMRLLGKTLGLIYSLENRKIQLKENQPIELKT